MRSCSAPSSACVKVPKSLRWRTGAGNSRPRAERLPAGYGVEERAGDKTSARARGRVRRAIGVGDEGEGRVPSFGGDCRIVEFVAAQKGARRPERAVGRKLRFAIAERHAALEEARLDAKQPRHRMRGPRGVDEARPERHVAAAFAMNRLPAG